MRSVPWTVPLVGRRTVPLEPGRLPARVLRGVDDFRAVVVFPGVVAELRAEPLREAVRRGDVAVRGRGGCTRRGRPVEASLIGLASPETVSEEAGWRQSAKVVEDRAPFAVAQQVGVGCSGDSEYGGLGEAWVLA
jgi:hypothetical protein